MKYANIFEKNSQIILFYRRNNDSYLLSTSFSNAVVIKKKYLPVIGQSVIAQSHNSNEDIIRGPAEKLFSNLSSTHFVTLLPIEDPLERTFYEIESIRGCWSARELKKTQKTD